METGSKTSEDDIALEISILKEEIKVSSDNKIKATNLTKLASRLVDLYKQTKAIDQLEEAIFFARQAVTASPLDDPELPQRLHYLGVCLSTIYGRKGVLADLKGAIAIGRQALDFTKNDSPERALRLSNLALRFWDMYEATRSANDIEEAVRFGREAVHATLEDDPDLAGRLNNLAGALNDKAAHYNRPSDLEEAVMHQREAIKLEIPGSLERALYMDNLGVKLRTLYSFTGVMADLDDAVKSQRDACDSMPSGNALSEGNCLDNLGISLATRYSVTGAATDLDESICLSKRAISKLPPDHPSYLRVLNNLWVSLESRLTKTGLVEDLSQAIEIGRQVATQTPREHEEKANRLHAIAKNLEKRYLIARGVGDLEESIHISREVVAMTPNDHSKWPERLAVLGHRLYHLYKKTQTVTDLEESISLLQRAAGLGPRGQTGRILWLSYLGSALNERYILQGPEGVPDLEKAISVYREAVLEAPQSNPELPRALYFLCRRLHDRYEITGSSSDIDEAIENGKRALSLASKDGAMREAITGALNFALEARFSRNGLLTDIDEAIELDRQALTMASECGPDRANFLTDLARHLSNRYSRTERSEEIEEAIMSARQAVAVVPNNHPAWCSTMSNLALRLADRYSQGRSMQDLEECIQIHKNVISKTPAESPVDLATSLGSLGEALNNRYLATGDMNDLQESIVATRRAAATIPDGHRDHATILSNLGRAVRDRGSATGSRADIDEGIQLMRKALTLMPDDGSDTAATFNSLAAGLYCRYEVVRARTDLNEAIRFGKLAADGVPEGCHDWVLSMNNIGNWLAERYLRLGNEADLEESIRIGRQIITTVRNDDPRRPIYLHNLAGRLEERWSKHQVMSDLEEAIKFEQQAISTVSSGYFDRWTYLNSLGGQLFRLYSETKSTLHLQQAITAATEAVSSTREGSSGRTIYLNNLTNLKHCEYKITNDRGKLEESAQLHWAALNESNSPTVERIHAAKCFIPICSDLQQAYEAAKLAIDLVPNLCIRSLETDDRQHLLSRVGSLASDAAAAALGAGRTPQVALGLLEKGRGMLATSLEELRADIAHVRQRDTSMADEFLRLANQLEMPSVSHSSTSMELFSSSYAGENQRYKAGNEFDDLVAKIRKLPAFEDFLLPPCEAQILEAASCGPVIIINVSELRCDALLVETNGIRALHLPDLCKSDIEERSRTVGGPLTNRKIFEWLWDVAACPILEALGFTKPQSKDETLPHVWWIPTGLLTRFPIHAAGYHRKRSGNTVLDRVMSSYSSSVSAIVRGRKRRQIAGQNKMLFIAMEHTPGQSSLPFAIKEEAVISEMMNLEVVSLKNRRKGEAMAQLKDCQIFHFAGHGFTDQNDPSNSRLLLEDWKQSPLRVADLLELNLKERSPFLAYLSACGTSQIHNESLADESIHLVSACQLSGFRHVIGTLTSVEDEMCVEMARITYKEILDGGMTDGSVCRGVHKASQWLRDKWLSGKSPRGVASSVRGNSTSFVIGSNNHSRAQPPRDIFEIDSSEDDYGGFGQASWAPYVHFGV
ncbi:unnamed protein product [Clonostachys rhizophaga]|uniref:CHAT domain-containing protein n=1 Tax=Clonostachys rhizophaga TaxID=160324 RepID=A0A9N9VRD1_9HYPO|nr:unnamed protein product [Clonostachys rhizophaga]